MIKDVEMIRLFNYSNDQNAKATREDERKYKKFFKNFNLTKCFYFSYTYNLTIKLQEMSMKKIKSSSNIDLLSKTSQFGKRDNESENEPSDINPYSSFANLSSTNTAGIKHEGFQAEKYYPWNENYQWNYHLIKEFFSILDDKRWVLPIIYGYVSCTNFDIKST